MKRMPFVFAMVVLFIHPFPAPADERPEEKPALEVTIQLKEYAFAPEHVTLKRGEKVKLTLKNRGTVMHEFVSDAFKNLTLDVVVNGVITEAHGVSEFEIPPGAEVTLRFTPGKKDMYPFVCKAKDPKDHLKEGMSGRLVFD